MKEIVFFKNLDALRFLAFLGVFFSHVFHFSEVGTHGSILDFILTAFSFFYLGVPFFFTLSSFLITYRLLEESKINKTFPLTKFYLKRGLRIWPIYFLLLLICFLALPTLASAFNMERPTLPDALPFVFFWANFYIIEHGVNFITALIVLWSLAIEEQFYIFWGFILKHFQKYLMAIIIILLALSIAFCYYYLYVLHQKSMNLKIHSLYALPNFCLGGFIGMICHLKNKIFIYLKTLNPLFFLMIYLALIFFNTLQNFGVLHFDIIIIAVFNAVCYGLILFDQTFNDKRFFNLGKWKPINYLGKISYGLYIYHLLIFSIILKLALIFKINNNFIQAATALCFTIIAAHISYQYFEKYFLKLKNNL